MNSYELLSPFAPAPAWLFNDLILWILRFNSNDGNNRRVRTLTLKMTDIDEWSLDCCDSATRFAVLTSLAKHGHALPWALGGIWSPLTDEQAGRVVAEAVRRVGADPARPVGVVPTCVASAWERVANGQRRRRAVAGACGPFLAVNSSRDQPSFDGRIVEKGALLWEQITPSEVE